MCAQRWGSDFYDFVHLVSNVPVSTHYGLNTLLENRAAIFALAILLGHLDLEPFVGELLEPDLRAQASRIVGTVTLRGRKDWTRHF